MFLKRLLRLLRFAMILSIREMRPSETVNCRDIIHTLEIKLKKGNKGDCKSIPARREVCDLAILLDLDLAHIIFNTLNM